MISPFSLSSNNEVVNGDGSAISKISELGFPNDKGVRICDGISILKAEHTVFTEMTVCDSDIIGDCFQKGVFFNVSLLIADVGMSMRKCSSFDILA